MNVASVDGLYGFGFDRLPYAASKAAVVQLSEGMALYLRPKGIGVTCFCPGPIATNIGDSIRHFGRPVDVRGAGKELTMMPPVKAAAMIVDAIRKNHFLVASHTATYDYMRLRATDTDAFVEHQIDHPQVLFSAAVALRED